MNKQKILILTLGTGSVFGSGDKAKEYDSKPFEDKVKRLREMIENGEYPYKKTKYVTEKDHEGKESEYVAEIQIKEFCPDRVIIIGTVKSCWSMFYRKFTQKNESIDDVMTLFDIEQKGQYGIDTDVETLKELGSKIQKIYNERISFGIGKKIDIKICLIRYGINNAQLEENYRCISGIEEDLDKDVDYEVAFDITHSFRSLPIYNLVILNYLQQVSQFNIKISHIYYGNFDAKWENNNEAPLVDLAGISDVLNLTNAVSEFKNTGNAKSLIELLPDSEEELRKALKKFDMATQLNGRNDVFSALRELKKVLEIKSDKSGRYEDAKEMIYNVLSEPDNLFEIAECKDIGKAQLILAKWYQRQNRYGLAVATASEALRSLLVPFYLKDRGNAETDCENEKARRSAVQRLGIIKKLKSEWYQSKITDLLVEIEERRATKIKEIRDKFAHNLSDKEDEYEDDVSLDSKECVKCVDEFIDLLSELHRDICKDKDEFERVYNYKYKPPKRIVTGKKIIILISDDYNKISYEEYNCLERDGNGDENIVYKLPSELLQISNKATEEAFLLKGITIGEYIKFHFPDKANIQIVFDWSMCDLDSANYSDKKWMNYSVILYKLGFEKISIIIKRCKDKDNEIKYNRKPVAKPVYEIKLPEEKPEINCFDPPIEYKINK